MYILIAGGGVVGRNLVKQLVKQHDVVVIDEKKEVCERIYAQYGAVTIYGNATKINTLRQAGIEKTDVAVSVMDQDADNLAFALLANNFGVERIMVRMRDPEYKEAYKLAGATTIAGIVEMMAKEFVLDIKQPEVRKVYSLSGGKAEISILNIPEEAVVIGSTISEIARDDQFPDELLIAGIFDKEEERLIIPHGDTEINSGNQVFLVGPADKITQAANYLTE